jgi:hypothetical protein
MAIFCISLFNVFGFEESLGYGYYRYINRDGSLDWETFYAKWDEVPDSYFIYLVYATFPEEDSSRNNLIKVVGGIYGVLDPTMRNDIRFTVEQPRSKLEIVFSPFNYTNDFSWIRVGQKRYNYREAIERWNFMLDNML